MIGPMCLAFLVLQQISEPKDIAALKMLRTAGRLGLRTTSVVWSKPAPFILQRCSAHTSLFPIKTGNCDVSLWRGLSSAAKPPEPVKSIVEARGGDLVLSPPALVVTREFEWGNIVLGFEQANKYTIRAAPGGEVVGYIAEENSLGKSITRNVLRKNRPFRATVLDKHGDPVFVIRRPFYVVSTSMFVETPEGEVMGEVYMNWHLYRRRYSMYIDKQQFARVDSGFLAWDFSMRDEEGRKIASVNKDFTGFAREIFTDAGQYVLRLDPSMEMDAEGLVNEKGTAVPAEDATKVGAKLTKEQRAVLLSTAILIDFDYFSQHSRGMGPGMFMPIPMGGGGGGGGAGAAGTAVGADTVGAMMGGDDDGLGEEGVVDGDDFGSDSPDSGFQDGEYGGDFQAPDNANQEWGTFEEADHGFTDDPSSDGSGEWGFGDASDVGDAGEAGEGASQGIGWVLENLGDFFGGDS